MTGTALILGATGRFGRNATEAFGAAGWHVRVFDRGRDDLERAARGADVIVSAWNPPYPEWRRLVPGLHRRVIEAARRSGATVILPGNVYVFGPDVPAPWSEMSPHRAFNPLGRVRIELEEAYRASGVRTIALRAGDFLDSAPSGNWFDRIMVAKLDKGILVWPGEPDIPRAWAFLPDLCRAAVELAGIRAELPRFCDVPFPGYTLTGDEIAQHLGHLTGRPVRLRRMSWLPFRLARPFWPMGRCLLEMRYLWNTPHRLDGARFSALCPGFHATPPAEALSAAIAHISGPQPGGAARPFEADPAKSGGSA